MERKHIEPQVCSQGLYAVRGQHLKTSAVKLTVSERKSSLEKEFPTMTPGDVKTMIFVILVFTFANLFFHLPLV